MVLNVRNPKISLPYSLSPDHGEVEHIRGKRGCFAMYSHKNPDFPLKTDTFAKTKIVTFHLTTRNDLLVQKSIYPLTYRRVSNVSNIFPI